MSRFFACAGLGIFLTLAASVLAIFAHISQINGNIVPRNLRMVNVETGGLGQAIGVGSSLYGTGARTGPNTGLRTTYQWGLWTYCEKSTGNGGAPDYCAPTRWANEWQPLSAILFDVPADAQSTVANALPSGVFTSSDYLGRYTKGAFYVLIVGTILGGLALLTGLLAHRIAYLLCAVLTLFAFLCTAVGCVIWTVVIARTRSSINDANLGILVSYGNALFIYWAATGCLFFAVLPFIFSCIAGRDRYY